MDLTHVEGDLELDQTLFTEEQIISRLKEMAADIERLTGSCDAAPSMPVPTAPR